jgi:hypothetical protein
MIRARAEIKMNLRLMAGLAPEAEVGHAAKMPDAQWQLITIGVHQSSPVLLSPQGAKMPFSLIEILLRDDSGLRAESQLRLS